MLVGCTEEEEDKEGEEEKGDGKEAGGEGWEGEKREQKEQNAGGVSRIRGPDVWLVEGAWRAEDGCACRSRMPAS